MITFRGFLWKRERPCSAAPSEPSAGVRSLDIAIGYCLPVNHLPWYRITDAESTGRYVDIWSSAVFSPAGFAAIPEVLFSGNLPGFWE
jgi:hypothetical protein